ncbi:MAG: aminodeoxychorismate synthase component I [Candidatus Omnitrophica bacterium]|nr:aminodeoxychorismate synthase component I [Candidatus Omnitrophota bacterium]
MKTSSLKKLLYNLKNQDNFVFLETNRITGKDYKSYLFTNPIDIVSSKELSDIKPCLSYLENSIKKGCFAAGFLSYEAGFAFEEVLQSKRDYNFPFLWFGIYKDPVIFDHRRVKFTDVDSTKDYSLRNISLNTDEGKYRSTIERIKSCIEEGNTYQVNYTFKLDFSFEGSVFDLYLELRKRQSVAYSCLMRFGSNYILSFSPELFFRKEGNLIEVKPMKGTADRGRYIREDEQNKNDLHLSAKNRSENIMIVDLLRNDLGRVCLTDTVRTEKLFEVESYESLLQMTSTVEGRIRKEISLHDLFKAIFPSGSVTGAPKIRTMQIIEEIEKTPRNIYTGSIGFITPEQDATFNVAIRTLLIDSGHNKGEMGIGSGIVYDSDPGKEYAECKLKSKFLTEESQDFELIETLLWEPDTGYPLLDLHLERLSESASYFNFLYDKRVVIKALQDKLLNLDKKKSYRVRLLLNKEGATAVTSILLAQDGTEKLITLSGNRVSSESLFLFHKTTNRKIYDEEYKRHKDRGFCDIIFQNEKDEITEGAISNIFIKRKDKYYTPPVECGLLNGVYRRNIIKNKMLPIEERVLYPKDIESADEVLLTNAVRGITRVRYIKAEDMIYA